MATVAAHGLLVALDTAAEVLDERRASETDGRIRAAELVGDKLEDVRALELLEVDVLGLYRERSEPSGTRGVERAYGLDLVAALEVAGVAATNRNVAGNVLLLVARVVLALYNASSISR